MPYDIPNYTLLSKLGEGAMAEVWLAEHRINKRKAAIKILKPAALSDANAEKLFVREGEVLASFDHPNIVRIHEQGHSGNLCYLVMECLLGGDLLKRMDPKSAPVTVGEALGLTVQIAAGLEVAHRQQVVHRDLKPANIMLRNDTTPVLTDFGIARFLDRSISVYAQSGMIVGTAAYMSPEQVTAQELDGRSDLYALGILFFELLTGLRPFPGRSFQELALQHLHAPLPLLPAELAVLQPVLAQLLAKKKEDRYATAQDFIDELRLCYLNEIALRRQVGFAATSRAWSSQLRALGFVLDPPQLVEARIAQGEAEAARLAEENRQAEAARSAEAKRLAEEAEAARLAEEKRQAEATRIAEGKRQAEEAEAVRLAEEKRQAEAIRIAEGKRQAEEAEAARIAEEKRRVEAIRVGEVKRQAEEAEAARLAEEKRQVEAARIAEAKRQAKYKETRLAEEQRQAQAVLETKPQAEAAPSAAASRPDPAVPTTATSKPNPVPTAAPSDYLLRGPSLAMAALLSLIGIAVLLLPQEYDRSNGLPQLLALLLALQTVLHALLAWIGWRAERRWAALYAGLAALLAMIATGACLARSSDIGQIFVVVMTDLGFYEEKQRSLAQLVGLALLIGLMQAAWLLWLTGGRVRRRVALAGAVLTPSLLVFNFGSVSVATAGVTGILLWLLAGLYPNARLPVLTSTKSVLAAICLFLAITILTTALTMAFGADHRSLVPIGLLWLAVIQGVGTQLAWRGRQLWGGLYCSLGLVSTLSCVLIILLSVSRPNSAIALTCFMFMLFFSVLHCVWFLNRNGGRKYALLGLALVIFAFLVSLLGRDFVPAGIGLYGVVWLLAAWRVGLAARTAGILTLLSIIFNIFLVWQSWQMVLLNREDAELAWEQALVADTAGAYQTYVELWPEGARASEAKSRATERTELESNLEKTLREQLTKEDIEKLEFNGGFINFGNDTLRDTKTGLVWTRTDGQDMNWGDATTYCKEKGMRIPTRNELIAIFNRSGVGETPCDDHACKISPLFKLSDNLFWSSTRTFGEEKDTAWAKYQSDSGFPWEISNSSAASVLCVSSAKSDL